MTKPMKQNKMTQQTEAPTPSGAGDAPPVDAEVKVPATRRRFTAAYKLRIIEEADRCTAPGETGALLRKEGLYSSHLTLWRRQRDEGALAKLAPKKRGRKSKPVDPSARRVVELEREIEHLRHKLEQATTIIEVQKKVSSLLGIPSFSATTGGRI
jgi:transposase-like protein